MSPSKVGLWATGVSLVAAGGVALGVAWASPVAPESLRPSSEVSAFPVHSTTFEDVRTLRLDVVWGGDTSLTAPGSGLVTRSDCRPGAAISSGSAPLAVDDVPVIALATKIPLWRDLEIGSHGDDVEGLQEELARLGYPVPATGTLGKQTREAIRDLFESVGGTLQAGEVRRSDFLWLPEPAVVPEECAVAVGAPVEEGSEVATIPAGLASVSFVDAVPGDLMAGPRVLTVDDVEVAVDPRVPITDPEALAALEAAASIKAAAEGGDPPVARIRLETPIEVSVVPPSAVVVAGDETCVRSSGEVLAVRVVGSELGETFVVFESGAPLAVDTTPAPGETCS